MEPQELNNPAMSSRVTGGGITCEAFEWDVRATVRFPEIYLDVRPYPATLVRWPTAVRNGGLGESSGVGVKDYIPYGGGSPGNPQEGDWQDLRLILTLRPAGMMFVTLPHIGNLVLTGQGLSHDLRMGSALASSRRGWATGREASQVWMNCPAICPYSWAMAVPRIACSGSCATSNTKASRNVWPDRAAMESTTAAVEPATRKLLGTNGDGIPVVAKSRPLPYRACLLL